MPPGGTGRQTKPSRCSCSPGSGPYRRGLSPREDLRARLGLGGLPSGAIKPTLST